MSPRLIEQGAGREVAHELLFQNTSVGTSRLDDIRIPRAEGGKVRAEIVAVGGGRYVVRDALGRGGVSVGGEPVTAARELHSGDVVWVGKRAFRFEVEPGEERPAAKEPSLGRGVARLTVGTLVSRLLGYVREMVAMAYFGLTGALDAYVAATTLPNLLRDVLGEYAAENAFMPTYKTLLWRGHQAAAAWLLKRALWFVVGTCVVLVVLGAALAPWVVVGLVPGFARRHPELVATATALAQWMMPYLLIIATAAVFGSLLLAERRFLRYSLAPAGTSLCVIGAIVWLSGRFDVASLGIGMVAGGMVQLLICAWPYIRLRRPVEPRNPKAADRGRAGLRKVGRAAVPIAMAGLLGKVNPIVDRALASVFCGLGRISALYCGARLMQLPFGILGLAVGRAAFPTMVEEASGREAGGFARAVVRALRLNAFLMLPATIGLVVLARPLVRLLFERGAFTPEHTALAVTAVVFYALGLVGMGGRTVLARAFYAMLDTRTPFLLSAVAVGLNAGLSAALVITPLSHGGLALATALTVWAQSGLLLFALHRHLAARGRALVLDELWRGLAKVVACGTAMAGAMAATSWGVGRVLPLGAGAWAAAVRLVVAGLVGVAAYLAVACALGCEELRELPLRRRGRAGNRRQTQMNADGRGEGQ